MEQGTLSGLERCLIEGFQRNMPLEPRPYAAMGRRLGASEGQVIAALETLIAKGLVARIGPVFQPRTIGYSTLAALSVPPDELESVAALVSGYPEVNHNYQRTHLFNLWFVVTGPDLDAVTAVLRDIRRQTGRMPLNLPLETAYHIDLGFALSDCQKSRPSPTPTHLDHTTSAIQLSPRQEVMVTALQSGIPTAPEPFAEIAERCGVSEDWVLRQLRDWLSAGIVKRIGIVVRHRELGYRANGMVVWDIPDHSVDDVGKRFAGFGAVTLCYRRPRRAPRWPYNLFCMIHGQDRATVRSHVNELAAASGMQNPRYGILFSVRRFKQRGALYRRADDASRRSAPPVSVSRALPSGGLAHG